MNTNEMITNGKMARILGIDSKTLRKWAKKGLIPSYINRYNGYRYYFKREVLTALRRHKGNTNRPIDRTKKKW